MTIEEINKAKKKRGYKGTICIPYEVNGEGKCITPCPYKQKTPTQKLAARFRKQGIDIGREEDVAKVGSGGCACCWYNLGHLKDGITESKNVLICGYEAKKTIKKADSLGLQCGTYKTPRKLK